MTHYNKLNVKLFNSQLNELKSAIKNRTKVTLNLSWSIVFDFNYGINFVHNVLSTYTEVPKTRKAFANGSSTKIKFYFAK